MCSFCFAIISPWRKARTVILTNLNFLHPRMFCIKFVWNWQVVLEKKILKSCQRIVTISLLSPLGEGMALHLNKLESHPIQTFRNLLLPDHLSISSRVLKKIFNKCINFTIFILTLSPLRVGDMKLNPSGTYPLQMLHRCSKFGKEWPSSSLRRC